MATGYFARSFSRFHWFLWSVVCALALSGGIFIHHQSSYDPCTPLRGDVDMQLDREREAPSDARVLFVGDSITARWQYRSAIWSDLLPYSPANLGVGGERVAETLWRVRNGELDHFHARVIVLLIGTNDIASEDPPFYKHGLPREQRIAAGIALVVQAIRAHQPQAHIVLMDLLPRRGRMAHVRAVNRLIAFIPGVTHLDLGPRLMEGGEPAAWATTDGLHLTDSGYSVWAQNLLPVLASLIGQPPRTPSIQCPAVTGIRSRLRLDSMEPPPRSSRNRPSRDFGSSSN